MASVVVGSHPAPAGVQSTTTYHNVISRNELGKQYVRPFKILGIFQVVLGILSILLSIFEVAITVGLTYRTLYSGFWCGIFFIVAGILGIVAAKQPSYCQINALMAFSILSSITSFIMMSAYSSLASQLTFGSENKNVYPLAVMLALTGTAEFFASITASAFCCASTCCHCNSGVYVTPTTVVTTRASAPIVSPGQVIQIQGNVPVYQPIPQNPAQHIQSYQFPHQPVPYIPTQAPPQSVAPPFQQFPAVNPYYIGVPSTDASQPPPYTPQPGQPPFYTKS